MFGIGFVELVIILVIALIVVGPERMPDMARQIGKTIRDLRRMYDNLRSDLGPDFDEVERAIRTLRSLDPRRELDSAGRKLITDLARDIGPEAETIVNSSPNQLKDSVAKSLMAQPSPATNAAAADLPAPVVGDDYIAEPTQVIEPIELDPAVQQYAEAFQPAPPATPQAPVIRPPDAPTVSRARTYPASSFATSAQSPATNAQPPALKRARTYDVPAPTSVSSNGKHHNLLTDTVVLDATHQEEEPSAVAQNGHGS
jgi:sec-independent protein translocase protein TatB